ncbi:unnamed protein product [Owenia fusiformis]|uniref:WW domain-containing protein n=1 Tax=Owenia fusiformis TaxID=6347 RepID=A0A8S4NZ90_OWEFU|nr:unnamed protein product [Owenia fusiformis]
MENKKGNMKPHLPHGWVAKQSKSYPDRLYYFNILTGSTSWEVPKSMPKVQNKPKQRAQEENDSGIYSSPSSSSNQLSPLYSKTNTTTSTHIRRTSEGGNLSTTKKSPVKLAHKPVSAMVPRASAMVPRAVSKASPRGKPVEIQRKLKADVSLYGSIPDSTTPHLEFAENKWKPIDQKVEKAQQNDISSGVSRKVLQAKSRSGTGRTVNPQLVRNDTEITETKRLKKPVKLKWERLDLKPKEAVQLKRKSTTNLSDVFPDMKTKPAAPNKPLQNPPKSKSKNELNSMHRKIPPSQKSTMKKEGILKRQEISEKSKSPLTSSNQPRPKTIIETALGSVSKGNTSVQKSQFEKSQEDTRKVVLANQNSMIIKTADSQEEKHRINNTPASTVINKNPNPKRRKSREDWLSILTPNSYSISVPNAQASAKYNPNPMAGLNPISKVAIGKLVNQQSGAPKLSNKPSEKLVRDISVNSQMECSQSEPEVSSQSEQKLANVETWLTGLEPMKQQTPVATSFQGLPLGFMPFVPRESSSQEMEVEMSESEKISADLSKVRSTLDYQNYEAVGKLTQMIDVTMVPDGKNTAVDVDTQKVFIILDTNILMNDLNFVEEIKDQDFKGVGKPHLVIPWVVMQELDALKDSKDPRLSREVALSTQLNARKPVNFLYNCHKCRHPRVIGQTPQEQSISLEDFEIETNDDKVIQCCLLWSHKYPRSEVCLFTNDMHLTNKASVMGINVFYTQKELVIWLKSHEPYVPPKPVTPVNHNPLLTEATPTDNKESVKSRLQQEISLADDILCECKSAMRGALTVVLQVEMEQAFEHLWRSMVFRKPPWSFYQLLECLQKHWIAVFGLFLSRNSEDCIKNLLLEFKPSKEFGKNVRQAKCILRDGLSLLNDLCKHSSLYGSVFEVALKTIQQLVCVCDDVLADKVPPLSLKELLQFKNQGNETSKELCSIAPIQNQSTMPSTFQRRSSIGLEDLMDSPSPQRNSSPPKIHMATMIQLKFQNIWESLLSYGNQMPQLEDPVLRTEENINLLRRIVFRTMLIHQCFEEVLKVPCDSIKEHFATFDKLVNCLNCYFTDIGVDKHLDDDKISTEQLMKFYKAADNREMLQVGFNQLLDIQALYQKNMHLLNVNYNSGI